MDAQVMLTLPDGSAISARAFEVHVEQALVSDAGAGGSEDGSSLFLDAIQKFENADSLITGAMERAQTAVTAAQDAVTTAEEAVEAASGASGAIAAVSTAAAAATQAKEELLAAAGREDFDGADGLPGPAGTDGQDGAPGVDGVSPRSPYKLPHADPTPSRPPADGLAA